MVTILDIAKRPDIVENRDGSAISLPSKDIIKIDMNKWNDLNFQ